MSKIIKRNIISIICTILVAITLSFSVWLSTCENTRNSEIQSSRASVLTHSNSETSVNINSFK